MRTGTFTTTVHRDYSSVIAAIPIMALLALCIMAALVTLFAAAFRSVGPHGATPAVFAPAGKERMSHAPAHPIHVLMWVPGISCHWMQAFSPFVPSQTCRQAFCKAAKLGVCQRVNALCQNK